MSERPTIVFGITVRSCRSTMILDDLTPPPFLQSRHPAHTQSPSLWIIRIRTS